MEQYAKILNDYLSQNPLGSKNCRMRTLLDRLCCCYYQQKGEDTAQIRRCFGKLDKTLKKLPIKEQDAVMDICCSLSSAHQRQGFQDGVLVGFHLFRELSERKENA